MARLIILVVLLNVYHGLTPEKIFDLVKKAAFERPHVTHWSDEITEGRIL